MGNVDAEIRIPVPARARSWLFAVAAATLWAPLMLCLAERAAAQDLGTPPSSSLPAETPAALTTGNPAEFIVGAPHLQTIAQGLVNIEGPAAWRVRELGVDATGAPEMATPSFILQRTEASIVRNELTGRRTRLEPGEAYFMAAGDPFLRYAIGSAPSIIWLIELVAPEAATPDASDDETMLFTGDAINEYPRGTFDIELHRGILLPGDVSELPPHTGPALVTIASGRVQVSTDGSQPAPMAAGSARLVSAGLTLRNGDAQPAAFLVAALGEPVDGPEQPGAAARIVSETPPPAPSIPTEVLPPVETIPVEPPPVPIEPTPMPAAPVAAKPPSVGGATIRVIAEGDIEVTIVADDIVVFSGWLGVGGATDWYTASFFVVTTSDGSLTLFENAGTGQQFYMGYGAYETYYLSG